MIIDSHVHLPSPGWSGHSSFLKTVAEAIAYLRKAGIQGVVFNTWQGVFAKTERDLDAGNRDALRLAKRYAGFLHPALIIHPDFPKASEAWLRRFHDLGLGWVGELVPPDPAHCCYMEDKFIRLAERCAEYGNVLQLHYYPDLISLAQRVPSCRIVSSHIPDQAALDKISKCPNIWVDISGMWGGLCMGRLEIALKTLGTSRLLFGSDFDGYEPRAFIERVKVLVASPRERRKIFETNVRNLLATCPQGVPSKSPLATAGARRR